MINEDRHFFDSDLDPTETQEWVEALEAVVAADGGSRARHLIEALVGAAGRMGVDPGLPLTTPYRNTINPQDQPPFTGDITIEERLSAIIRWNALAMVVRANRQDPSLGGHIASYASAADLFEVGFNHCFRASINDGPGDLVFLQPHSAPGVYARAFLEGRLSESQLDHYRREVNGGGLSSYPHPWLMPDFWQFPTGSMGLGPLQAVYQARFMRYLAARGLAGDKANSGDRHVWGIFGDGEMDEPESLGALGLAAREGLDNLTFVINCNLQRLDGPVRGNGKIIQELEGLFRGAGWNVIKVLWGSDWDALFARDNEGVLTEYLDKTLDGDFQTLAATDGQFNREHFFARDPRLQALVAHMTDDQIDRLRRGGHDPIKISAAYLQSMQRNGRPTVILAKTKKGYGMGHWGQGTMTSHQQKKLDEEALLAFRDRFNLPLDDDAVKALQFYRPPADSPEMQYLHHRREQLGGYLPARQQTAEPIAIPPLEKYGAFALQATERALSTTMVWARLLSGLLRDNELGPRIVPIVADEARTFGIANLFRQIGIYNPQGQQYQPQDADSMLTYREDAQGQLLEEGISEAGAMASWIAAGTAYSAHGTAMLPMYIYYSMFGFQRIGDLIWAAAEQRARGFLLGATAGRTTLNGEGLQHQDGSSHVFMATIPNCRSWDPAFAYEVATIMDRGMREMLIEQRDVFYYLTVMNEAYPQPALPDHVQPEDILSGLYCYRKTTTGKSKPQVRLIGSGTILLEVIKAAEKLAAMGIAAEVWSATSYSEVERDAQACRKAGTPEKSRISNCLSGDIPIVAASDYVSAWPARMAPYLDATFTVLGTDDFGRSDSREALRAYFGVDSESIVKAAQSALC
ncbi:pyruvate dehydrogenase (acetyl-transferring), homodimeric type [Spiribacter sp. C176]|uniref:Pyruvate dehydrogenase E1 component n=2 Tax=Spiribacter salilacus TaxID=2664894 RepID=A0A6N7QS10_9GAMM|nr:pyruvate dehydrogenase (acetyl-transferring), homodimeric type [Spiribacter salilacus]